MNLPIYCVPYGGVYALLFTNYDHRCSARRSPPHRMLDRPSARRTDSSASTVSILTRRAPATDATVLFVFGPLDAV
ncbi:hypothetical protein SCHPADRAFT_902589 [Schizopora paradoxa]|uniref:Uncharacterized protein n=1 Tax=Schizopora paradoxa TaxID=27342 RepID=A0A0H2RTJ0_9AGAM|nr:hypothetical protein SCHPADRAFT_902589 [Schizopora paradoxa]